jgi:hypothetical protein
VKYSRHQVSIYWHDLIALGLVELLVRVRKSDIGRQFWNYKYKLSNQKTDHEQVFFKKKFIIRLPFEANYVFSLKVLIGYLVSPKNCCHEADIQPLSLKNGVYLILEIYLR